jgi:GNAT superfamily N-acetyltransferase
MDAIEYRENFTAEEFIALANRVWPRSYDMALARKAVARTINIGAWDGSRLIGSVRVLSDGYFFDTISEILVEPGYQRQGIGRALMLRALAHAARGTLFFGAQPQSVGFFERIGCTRGPVGFECRRDQLVKSQ